MTNAFCDNHDRRCRYLRPGRGLRRIGTTGGPADPDRPDDHLVRAGAADAEDLAAIVVVTRRDQRCDGRRGNGGDCHRLRNARRQRDDGPQECLAIDGAVQAPVYAGSGFTDEHDVTLSETENFVHYARQAVVLYTDAEQAKAFYDASVRQWQACKHYTHTQSGSLWDVGPISDKDGVLSTITTQSNAQAGGWACGRALTANNNVVVDVNTCSANPADSAVVIAKQISARVDAPPSARP